MTGCYTMSLHAAHRAAQRSIPPHVAEIILDFGESIDAGDGARKFALGKRSMRLLRRALGPVQTRSLDRYRKRNAYVVLAADKIITVATARRPVVL